MTVVSASPMPRADSTPAIGGTTTVRMPSESATAQACWPPAPPNVVSAYRVTSWPFSTEIRLTALAMFATAICRNPSATCSGVRSSPASRRTSSASSTKRRRTSSSSIGWSPSGPNTRGKCPGWMRPSMTLASVTVSGPPAR